MESFSDFTRKAAVPEHLEHYARALGGLSPIRVGSFLAWRAGSSLVLIGYPTDGSPFDDEAAKELDKAVSLAVSESSLENITVLAPVRPSTVPDHATCHEDAYWELDLPVEKLSGKLANMLRRADALLTVSSDEPWGPEHEQLVASVSTAMTLRQEDRRLSSESDGLFSRIGNYVREGGSSVRVYTARRRDTGALCGLTVADHASYTTSFYLFAFRAPDAPPGTADALLKAQLDESLAMGQIRCNLGLGVHSGIRFFKEKWGARVSMPLVECAWRRKTFGDRLRAFFGRGR